MQIYVIIWVLNTQTVDCSLGYFPDASHWITFTPAITKEYTKK